MGTKKQAVADMKVQIAKQAVVAKGFAVGQPSTVVEAAALNGGTHLSTAVPTASGTTTKADNKTGDFWYVEESRKLGETAGRGSMAASDLLMNIGEWSRDKVIAGEAQVAKCHDAYRAGDLKRQGIDSVPEQPEESRRTQIAKKMLAFHVGGTTKPYDGLAQMRLMSDICKGVGANARQRNLLTMLAAQRKADKALSKDELKASLKSKPTPLKKLMKKEWDRAIKLSNAANKAESKWPADCKALFKTYTENCERLYREFSKLE